MTASSTPKHAKGMLIDVHVIHVREHAERIPVDQRSVEYWFRQWIGRWDAREQEMFMSHNSMDGQG